MAVENLQAIVHHLREIARKDAVTLLSDQDLLRRFLRDRDESAFEILLRRHGPLVLGVCRRVLRHDQDAEDAFQATFLVLVRKAATLRSPGTLANWLYGVANRTALEMRRADVKRRAKEALAMPRAEPEAIVPVDFRVAFDEELAKLPDKYREAVIVCDLQAKSRRESAQELGCAEGTVASRLARGRALLAQRLARRGIGISAGAVATAALGESALAHVPLSLTVSTTKAASLLVAGQALSGIVSSSIAAATEGTLKSMFLVKLKTLASFTLVLSAGLCTAGLLYQVAAAAHSTNDSTVGALADDSERDASTTITGRVVDERGAPVAGVSIETKESLLRPLHAKSDKDGNVRIALRDWPSRTPLVADDGNGRMGILTRGLEAPKNGFTIRLLPSKAVRVRVMNGLGKPIAGSNVFLVLTDLPTSFSGVTASDGKVALHYPREADIGFALAWKSGAGFDYVSTLVARRERERKPLPDQITLQLTGSRTVSVKAVDSSERPVAGLTIYPWTIGKPGKVEEANLSGCAAVHAKTDANGTAVFDWLPSDFVQGISFLSSSEDHSYVEIPVLRPEQPVDRLTMHLLRKAKLTGKVNMPDGRPAANINVSASGAGPAFHNFNGAAETKADGSYELLVNSEEAYVIKVVDKRWAAPSRIGVVVREDQPIENVDFTLADGTVLRGTVTVGPANRPSPEELIVLHESGGQIPPEIRKPGDRTYHEVHFQDSQMTNARGEYRFCVGPGTYKLFLRSESGEGKSIVVGDKREIVQVFHRARAEWGILNGRVLDQNGRPIVGAKIAGVYRRPVGWVDPESVSGPDGRFTVRRVQVPTALFANTPDNKLAGIVRIDADQEEVTIRVGPTARAAGRLLDADGAVVANGKVACGIRIYMGEPPNAAFSTRFGGSARSDASGRFVLEGLVPGEEYDFNQGHDERTGRTLYLTQAKAVKAETVQLGDVRPPKIIYETTPGEKAAEFFSHHGHLTERMEKAQAEAVRRHLRVLVIVGDPREARTQQFCELAQGPKASEALSKALGAFIQVAVASSDRESMDLLRQKYGLGSQPIIVPALAVLDASGAVVAARDSWLDNRNPELSAIVLTEFLVRHASTSKK